MSIVLALGDSIAHGVGDRGSRSIGPSWAGRLAHLVGARRLVNLSFPGARSDQMLRLQAPAAVALHPDIVLISVGGNDVLCRTFDPLQLAHHVKATIALLDEADCRVLLLGLPDPRAMVPAPRAVRHGLARRIWRANAALDEACRGSRARVLRTWDDPRVYERTMWHVDRLHPSPRGHEYLARQALRALELEAVAPALPVEVPSQDSRTWMVRHGAPWLTRRSADLLPGVVRMCREEIKARRADYPAPPAGGAGAADVAGAVPGRAPATAVKAAIWS